MATDFVKRKMDEYTMRLYFDQKNCDFDSPLIIAAAERLLTDSAGRLSIDLSLVDGGIITLYENPIFGQISQIGVDFAVDRLIQTLGEVSSEPSEVGLLTQP